MDTTKFELVAIDKLIPYARNARTHSPEQIRQLRSSLREFGFVSPAVIDTNYTILVGHGRVAAAREEGYTSVPCVFAENLTDAQKRAYILADNRLALNAGWDEELLTVEIADLDADAFDLSLLGFDDDEILSLLDVSEDTVKEDEFDEAAELGEAPITREGDIWHLGKHKLICADATDPETYQRLLGDTKVNLVCTDAPYFVDLDSASGKIKNDNLSDKEAYTFLMKVFSNFKNVMAKDASIYEFYATSKSRIFFDAFDDAGFKLGAGLIWRKERAPLMRTDWKFNFEPIMFGWQKDGKHKWYGDQKQKACFDFDGIKNSKTEGHGHPSSKPVALIAHLIKQSTQTNALVLDGFLGSASTLIAAHELGRICYGIEIEPKYCDVAAARYAALTGTTDDIYCIRDGETLRYQDLLDTRAKEAKDD
ncbi:site-specific DNA-methyltransferase [Alloscardovia omnicolens]|uniref:site-specific DNA-methyltransferase n=1 Tax=Alloscardovia omnicolens TaxID=419015 RepID=UPI003A619C18